VATFQALANALFHFVRSPFVLQGICEYILYFIQEFEDFLNSKIFQSGGESIDVNQIRSVKVSRGARNIPKAFEIFTADQTLILKPKDGKNAEEWVQCLSIVVAHSQARDNPTAKTNSLPARSMGSSKPSF